MINAGKGEVSQSFVPLFRWILSWWPTHEKRLALSMDATNLGNVLVVLVISVVYRGCAIPIAWRVLPAGQKGSWKQIWLDLFSHFQEVIPDDWLVIVMADRGLYAHWLLEVIQKCKWHPFFRINNRIFFRPKDGNEFRALQLAFHQPGCTWSGTVTCFKTHPMLVLFVRLYLSPKQTACTKSSLARLLLNTISHLLLIHYQFFNNRESLVERSRGSFVI